MGETCLDIRLCSCASLKHFPNHRTSIYSQITTPGHNKILLGLSTCCRQPILLYKILIHKTCILDLAMAVGTNGKTKVGTTETNAILTTLSLRSCGLRSMDVDEEPHDKFTSDTSSRAPAPRLDLQCTEPCACHQPACLL